MSQNKPEPASGETTDATLDESFSLFITRILNQLSLSSWLPAITLICNLALILQLRSQHNFDVGRAITSLTAKPLGTLIVLLLAIILACIVTQSFAFEGIRLLEGYWGSIRILGGVSRMRTNRHVERWERLEEWYNRYSRQAFNEAREEMLDRKIDRAIVDILDRQRRGELFDNDDPVQVAEAKRLDWRRFASPELLRRMDAVESLINRYPERHRILPTTLGNTLRSTEDKLDREKDEDLEDFVYHRYDLMGPELTAQHRRFRSQLDIYCLLTFIFSSLAFVSPVALVHGRAELAGGIAFAVAYAVLALISYQAAIASARGYVRVLKVIGSRSNSGRRG